jgi:predicted GNAT family acetyltransferase
MDETQTPVVTDNPAESRYEMHVDGELAGFVDYRLRDDAVISLVHTEIEPKFQGSGLATRLARFALDDARDRQLAVLPSCPYINSWIKKHPDYTDLVPPDRRDQFGLE